MLPSKKESNMIWSAITEKAKSGFFQGKETVIFGCNTYAKNIRDSLEFNGVKLNAVLDNDRKKQKMLCLHVPVYAPEEYLKEKKNVSIVIYSRYWREMIDQIESMGYRQEQAILLIPFYGHIEECQDSLEDFEAKISMVQKGYEIYKKIKEKNLQTEILFVCPYAGTGDVYMACSFLKQFLQKEKINKFVMLTVNKNCEQVINLFGITNVEVLNKEKMELLLNAWVFLGFEKMRIKPLLHWGWRTKNTPYIFDNDNLSFADMFRYDVFGLSDTDFMNYPIIDRKSDYAEKLFQSLNLPKGKTVVLAPYANSFVSEIKEELWEQMAMGLKKRGYEVCTNCAGAEVPIKNTKAIYFPYKEAVNVLEYAGGFLALRSGLCEIVSSAQCKMVIFYENAIRTSSYQHFGLKKMGLNPHEIAINYEKEEDIEKIFEVWKEII